MNRPQPPSLPLGWIALWDEASQRYYYVEQATGTTQWEIPTSESKATPDYHNGFPQQMPTGENSTYHGATNPVATTYPTQPSSQEGVDGERGLGKVFHGFSGGAIAGSLFGFAAGKFLGNHNHHGGHYHQQQGYANYYPPPPPPPVQNGFGSMMGGGSVGFPFSGNHGHHHHHGHHGHHGHHHGFF